MNVGKLAIVAGVVVITCSCATMIEGQSQVINLTHLRHRLGLPTRI